MASRQRRRRGLALLLVLVLGAGLGLFRAGSDFRTSDEMPILEENLPAQVGPWRGLECRFCNDPECGSSFTIDQLASRDVCPKCGGPLDAAPQEMITVLPPETWIVKRLYQTTNRATMVVTLIVSRERGGIHRPQLCLPLQGNEIVGNRLLPVSLPGGNTMRTMLMELLQRITGPEGQALARPSFFAYWFTAPGRETPNDFTMVLMMAWDKIFHNVKRKWAYISVSGERDIRGVYEEDLKQFLRELYPLVMKTRAAEVAVRLAKTYGAEVTATAAVARVAAETPGGIRFESPLFVRANTNLPPSPGRQIGLTATGLSLVTNRPTVRSPAASSFTNVAAATNGMPAAAGSPTIPWDVIALVIGVPAAWIAYRSLHQRRNRRPDDD